MSRTVYEGKYKVHYLPVCADTSAPTQTEITNGKNWSPFIAKDGVQTPNGQNMVDSATIEDVFDAQQVGSWGGGALTLTMFRDDTDEADAYDFITYGLEGFILIAPFGSTAENEVASVWPIEAHEPTLMQSAGNEMQKFSAAFAVTSAPEMRATIAA